MPGFLLLLGVAGGAWLLWRVGQQRGAAVARRWMRSLGIALAALLAVWLIARGANVLLAALPLLLALADRLTRILAVASQAHKVFGAGAGSGRSSGTAGPQRSEVHTAFLHMSLNHANGDMDGEVLRGHFTGQRLSDLSLTQLRQLLGDCHDDAQSVAVLEGFLDRYFPDWRDEPTEPPRAANGLMSREEALAVLGLSAGADAEAVRAAHRRLMQRVHPDHGGSDVLAARVNEAKRVLLGD